MIPETFLPSFFASDQSTIFDLCLLHDNASISNFSLILSLRFSITQEKTKIAAKTVLNWFMQLLLLQAYQKQKKI